LPESAAAPASPSGPASEQPPVATHTAPHGSNPVLQEKPQLVPSQVAAPFAGAVGHAVHAVPQLATLLLLAHTPVHRWNPALHESPHEVPSQLAVPLGSLGQAVHAVPQWAMLVLSTQAPLQSWNPLLQTNPHRLLVQVAVALAGGAQSLGPLQQPAVAAAVKPQLLSVQLATWQEFPVGHVLAVEQQLPVVDWVVNWQMWPSGHVKCWQMFPVSQSEVLMQPLPPLQVMSNLVRHS
jgi:hypothetical protein